MAAPHPSSTPSDPPRVLIDGPRPDFFAGLLDGLDLVSWDEAMTDEAILATIDGIYTYHHPTVDDALLARMPRLRVVSNCGLGVDHIDVAAVRRRGLAIGNTRGVLEATTADLGFALLLATARRVAEGDRLVRGVTPGEAPTVPFGLDVHHATLGILGLGAIGTEVGRRALGFSMKVIYHNRRRRPDLEMLLDADYVDLETLFRRSDFLVLCCPLTDQTRGLVDADRLALMKRSAILVNIARGPVVETDALIEALKARRIGGAGLDVTEPEPLPAGHPLLTLDNIVFTPHVGSATVATRRAMARLAAENLRAGLDGRELPCPLDDPD